MRKRILVCDDDQGISDVLTIILDQEGYEAYILNNGKGIQKKIEKFKPDLILLDIMMPGIDGKEITRILKRDQKTSKIPIIIFSALNNPDQIAKNIGADDFLAKPFNITDLVAKFKKHLS